MPIPHPSHKDTKPDYPYKPYVSSVTRGTCPAVQKNMAFKLTSHPASMKTESTPGKQNAESNQSCFFGKIAYPANLQKPGGKALQGGKISKYSPLFAHYTKRPSFLFYISGNG